MTEQQIRQKKPRKILGNGSSLDFFDTTNFSAKSSGSQQQQQQIQLLLQQQQQQQQIQLNQTSQTHLLNMNSCCNNNNNNNLTLSTSTTTTVTSHNLQQQQMERIRLANIMNQEMHALWPYGTATFLSPMLPAPNVALPPYALTGAVPAYAAVPIYQTVSHNAQLNFNSINDSLAKVELFNEKDCKDTSSSLRSSPILLSPESDSPNAIINSGAGGDAANTIPTSASNGTVTLSQAKFNELTRLALRGSEIAEKLAYTHRNRPCFKKIDSLCARMKQDLIRPDGVLPNINSQGIAWAVKDFIFVFTRVINAWIIIKGYVYNTPEGLNKVKAALSPDFAASFLAWQDVTMDFIENLIKSFVNLDNLVQSQKNVYQKSDNSATRSTVNTTPIKILQPGNPLLDDSFDFLNTSSEKAQQNSLNKNYIYTMVEDSEGHQREATVNGTYFKTGTYNPIKKDALLPEQSPSVAPAISSNGSSSLEQYFDEQLSEFWPPTAIEQVEQGTAAVSICTTSDFSKIKDKLPANCFNYGLRVLEQNPTEISNDYDPNGPPQSLGKDLIDKLNIMIESLMTMKSADMFFKFQFIQNYFPDFMAKHKNDFIDVRSIILKCQMGDYQHIYEVVHDVKKIIYTAKEFLKFNNDVKLQNSITAFDNEFNKLLSELPFEKIQFEHITGEPKEELYNYRK